MIGMKFHLNPKLFLLTYAICIGLAIGVIALAFQVDGIVNVALYDFGLQFDYEWATPYWTYLRIALIMLGLIITLNAISAILYAIQPHETIVVEQKPINKLQEKTATLQPKQPELPAPKEIMKIKPQEEDNDVEVMALPIVCNKCGKVFTQPLCMFDFKSGKPRLVNVCPYCSSILAVTGKSKSKQD